MDREKRAIQERDNKEIARQRGQAGWILDNENEAWPGWVMVMEQIQTGWILKKEQRQIGK